MDTAQAYGNLIVSSTNGAPVYLHDIAKVEDTVQDERIKMKFWVRGYGEPAATVVVAVNRQAGSNVVAVAKSVRDLLPIISAELPGSVRVTPIYDRSQTIVNSVDDVQATLLIAFVLVVAVIFVFLGRATDTLIPTVALPLSLLLTFMAMRVFGYSLDNLSLMALTLAIGFLVDDAIVFLENTVRLMEKGLNALQATLQSAREISFTILVHDRFARGRVFPSGLHVRAGRKDFPGIRDHHCRGDFRFGTGLADADSADVREAPEGAWAGHQAELDGANWRGESRKASFEFMANRSGGFCAIGGSRR